MRLHYWLRRCITRLKGIDISHWQKGIDIRKVKDSGYDFVICKAGGHEGNIYYKDECFKDFVTKALSVGLHVGAYFYSTAKNVETAYEEADYFNEILKDYFRCFTMPLYIDYEDKEALGSGSCSATVTAFCHRLAQHGYYAGVYASASVFKKQLKYVDNIAKWVAHWNTETKYTTGIHQYTNKELVAGYYVDGDMCYTNYPKIIVESGRNGFPLHGDVNNDGIVNSKDIVHEMKHIANCTDDSCELKYDINGDGKVNSKDVVNLMKRVSE